MKRFAGWALSAGLVVVATAANAQTPAPNDAGRSTYRAISDFDGPYERPYAAAPAPPPDYNYGAYRPYAGYGPPLMPPREVYAVLRDNGFSPLGIPHQRGFVYTIAVIDQNGQDGRLVIDARNGRILRFVPAYGYSPYGENDPAERMSGNGPEGALPPPTVVRGMPRPPAPIPHVASRSVPLPAPKPAVAVRPEQSPQHSAAVETKPATPPPPPSAPPSSTANASPATPGAAPTGQANAAPPTSATVGEAKPAPVIRPTQAMPKVQGLE